VLNDGENKLAWANATVSAGVAEPTAAFVTCGNLTVAVEESLTCQSRV
jgi:hypothetical protein